MTGEDTGGTRPDAQEVKACIARENRYRNIYPDLITHDGMTGFEPLRKRTPDFQLGGFTIHMPTNPIHANGRRCIEREIPYVCTARDNAAFLAFAGRAIPTPGGPAAP
jgi:hypothetical protein